MKKTLLTLGIVAVSSVGFSQGLYIAVGSGFAGSAGKEMIGVTEVSNNIDDTYTVSSIYGSFGKGIPVNLRGGFMLNENVGIELGFNYLLGSTITVEDGTTSDFNNIPGASYTDVTTTKGSQMRALPALVLTTNGETMSLYTRAGLIAPFGGKTTFNRTITVAGVDVVAPGNDGTTVIEGESGGSFSMGTFGAIGVNYNLSEKMQLFFELESIKLRIKSASQTLTKYEVTPTATGTAIDGLTGLDKEDIETIYVDSINELDNQDKTQPTKDLANTSNYNSLGFNIGIKILL